MKYLPRTLPPLLLLGAAVCGCRIGPPANAPVLTTNDDDFEPGDRIEVRLENETARPVGYNICFAFVALERPVQDGWEPVQVNLAPAPDAACTLELRTLSRGGRAESEIFLPSDLPPGSYRLATDVEVRGAMIVVESAPFEVLP